MGLTLKPLGAAECEKRKVPQDSAALVTAVRRLTSAYRAGAKKGDVLLKVGTKTVTTPGELRALVTKAELGDSFTLKVLRQGTQTTLPGRYAPYPRAGAFEQPITYKGRAVRSVELSVGVIPNVNAKWFEGVKSRFRSVAKALWASTYGNMCLTKVSLYDKWKGGDVIIETKTGAMVSSRKNAYGYWEYFTGDLRIRLGGGFYTSTFLHEFGHTKFLVPEEYNSPYVCRCRQSTGNTMTNAWCERAKHKGRGPSCWERILSVYPEWTPSTAQVRGPPPPVAFSVVDR
jgi:hypothetical protein